MARAFLNLNVHQVYEMPDFTTNELYLAELNILSTINTLSSAVNQERIYKQYLVHTQDDTEVNNNDLRLRSEKIACLVAGANVAKCLANVVTEEEFDDQLSIYKESINIFLDTFSSQDDQTIITPGREQLHGEQAYLQVSNELKAHYDVFTSSDNKDLLRCPGWKELRASVEQID